MPGAVNEAGHHFIMQCPAGEPGVLEFMWTPLDMWHIPVQVHPLMASESKTNTSKTLQEGHQVDSPDLSVIQLQWYIPEFDRYILTTFSSVAASPCRQQKKKASSKHFQLLQVQACQGQKLVMVFFYLRF